MDGFRKKLQILYSNARYLANCSDKVESYVFKLFKLMFGNTCLHFLISLLQYALKLLRNLILLRLSV